MKVDPEKCSREAKKKRKLSFFTATGGGVIFYIGRSDILKKVKQESHLVVHNSALYGATLQGRVDSEQKKKGLIRLPPKKESHLWGLLLQRDCFGARQTKKCNLTLAVSPTCPWNKPFAYLLSTLLLRICCELIPSEFELIFTC